MDKIISDKLLLVKYFTIPSKDFSNTSVLAKNRNVGDRPELGPVLSTSGPWQWLRGDVALCRTRRANVAGPLQQSRGTMDQGTSGASGHLCGRSLA